MNKKEREREDIKEGTSLSCNSSTFYTSKITIHPSSGSIATSGIDESQSNHLSIAS